jgi:hypothetical protein
MISICWYSVKKILFLSLCHLYLTEASTAARSRQSFPACCESGQKPYRDLAVGCHNVRFMFEKMFNLRNANRPPGTEYITKSITITKKILREWELEQIEIHYGHVTFRTRRSCLMKLKSQMEFFLWRCPFKWADGANMRWREKISTFWQGSLIELPLGYTAAF